MEKPSDPTNKLVKDCSEAVKSTKGDDVFLADFKIISMHV